MKRWTIYVLRDPKDVGSCYVGQTCTPLRHRYTNHMSRSTLRAAQRSGRPVGLWIAGILARGDRPTVEALEIVTSERAANEAERRWIATMRATPGVTLLNATAGGNRHYGPEFGQRMRCVLSDPAVKEKMIAGVKAARAAERAVKTHCVNGHELTPENTMWRPAGRVCRACFRKSCRESYARHRDRINAERRAALRAARGDRPECCPNGHPYPAETPRWKNGSRRCKQCHAASARRYRKRHGRRS